MSKHMKWMIPACAGLLLVLILGIIYIVQKNTPNKERMELSDYFGVEKDSEQAILIVEDEITEASCLYREDRAYIALDYVKEHLNSRFYWDENENLLLYTTPATEISVEPGTTDCLIGRSKEKKDYVMVLHDLEQIYIAADYIKEYTAFEYQVYQQPNRIVVKNIFDTEKDYVKTSDTSTLRYQPDIKSLVLRELEEGAELRLLSKENTETGFCQVMEETGIIGYVKAKDLEQVYQKQDSTEFQETKYTHILKDEKISLVWHQVTSKNANADITEILSSAKGVNVVCPTWLKTSDNEGGVDSSLADYDYVTQAHNAGVEVWGLCDDQSPNMKIGTVLGSTNTRLKLVNNLVAKAIQYNLDGINIDFEYVKQDSGEDFIQFIRELSIKCRTNALVLSIDNYPLMSYNEYYNRREQANVADYVITMAYDEYTKNSGEAGPVSSLSYVQDSISGVLLEVPKEQALMALPFYSRHWQERTKDGEVQLSVESCSMAGTQTIVERSGAKPVWDDTTGQNYLEYRSDGALHRMWIEDKESLELKMKEVFDAKLAGYAFWKYGLENKDVWNMIVKYLN